LAEVGLRITSIEASGVAPIQRFNIDRLSDVVVLAGPNGVGKSRFVDALLAKLQSPTAHPNIRLVLEATNATERTDWKKTSLDTAVGEDANALTRTLQKGRNRRQWTSSVIHFESDRSIQALNPFQFSWDVLDPWNESVGWNTTFGGLRARFQDTMHSLFRKVQSHEKEIARKAIEMQKAGIGTMPLDFPDPMEAFKEAFEQLVAPKRLLDPDARKQQLFYEDDGKQFPLKALSSGEREVVNIVFDFILRTSSDCIVFFDEPELHLHPELSYKLLQALRSAGTNQFIFCTHSADIITASLDHTVVFVSPPRLDDQGQPANQALRVEENDSTNQALKLLGQSIGIISLGRRIVLIEGASSSLDKQTYGFLLRNRFPALVLVPAGGKEDIQSFSGAFDRVLSKTLWGVEFFMLCDRDAAQGAEVARFESESKQRLRFLKRYHLENYFLEASVLAKLFEDTEPADSWLRSPDGINEKLRELAKANISYAAALIVARQIRRQVGNVDVMPKGVNGKSVDELVALVRARCGEEAVRASAGLDEASVESLTRKVFAELELAANDSSDAWKHVIPGKQILSQFARAAGMDVARLKLAFLNYVARHNLPVFDDVLSIFEDFANYK
jgi:predicted ATPase